MIKNTTWIQVKWKTGRKGEYEKFVERQVKNFFDVQWIRNDGKIENQVTKEWIWNWSLMSSAKKNWMWWMKNFLSSISLSPSSLRMICYLICDLPFSFTLRCLICIPCSQSKFKPTVKERPVAMRHNAKRTWCYMELRNLMIWRNPTSIKWTRIREMPITYVSSVAFYR